MIPETIDPLKLIAELNAAGWRDYKIEMCAYLPTGYIQALRSQRIKNPRYETAAKLYNFHATQIVPRETENCQNDVMANQSLAGYASRRSGPCSP